MTIPDFFPRLSRPARYASPFRPLSAATCCLAVALCAPTALRAGESQEPRMLALAQPSITVSEPTIRLKLHPIEVLSLDEAEKDRDGKVQSKESAPDIKAADSTDASQGSDELKKRAQARYLAAKLKKHESIVRKYVDMAWAEADKRDQLAPELLIAIMQKESALRPKVQSRYGAQGLMQVVRRWHRDKLHPSESLFDPEVNIRVGADVLEEYLELADGNLNTALRKYSGNARGYVNVVLRETQALSRVAEQAAAGADTARG